MTQSRYRIYKADDVWWLGGTFDGPVRCGSWQLALDALSLELASDILVRAFMRVIDAPGTTSYDDAAAI